MKSLIQAVVVATVLAAPVVSFAQSNEPVTRAQVRQELIQLEAAGYNPAVSDPNYPADIQAAEKRVQAQNPVTAQQQPVADTSGYGPSTSGSSASGTALSPAQQRSVYFGN
jgi:hypothetical protein